MLKEALTRWNLIPDGELVHTKTSQLLPVQFEGRAAMLKAARTREEEQGHGLMKWLDGHGAAQIYRHDSSVLLMERLDTDPSLSAMVMNEQDDQATQILCGVVKKIHQVSKPSLPQLTSLKVWFRALEQQAQHNKQLFEAWDITQKLLDKPQNIGLLHGDIHHGNVMHSTQRGWLAIDPKGLFGERTYDYANIVCNPSYFWASRPGRLAHQIQVIAQNADLESIRLTQWIVAYTGLSAAWYLEDQNDAKAKMALDLQNLALETLD